MAKADAWMPLWIGDYLKDTSRLGLAEHGAYLKLLMDSWVNGPPADDDAELCRILGCQPLEWRKIRPKISRFFAVSGGLWRHGRLEAEKAGAVEASGKAASKARGAARARWDREKEADQPPASMPQAMLQAFPEAVPEHMHEQCPSPVTCSVPSEQGVTPDQRAWREGVALLTSSGRMQEPAARRFFGRLLKDNRLEPYRLLASITAAEVKGTQDPQAYLTAAAKRIGQGEGGKPVAVVATWDADVWRSALDGYRERAAWDTAVMGPTPDEPGCWAPASVLTDWRAAA